MSGNPIEFNGQSKTLTAWAKDLGVRPTVLFNRIRQGWSIEKTLTTPKVPRKRLDGRPQNSVNPSNRSIITQCLYNLEEQKRGAHAQPIEDLPIPNRLRY